MLPLWSSSTLCASLSVPRVLSLSFAHPFSFTLAAVLSRYATRLDPTIRPRPTTHSPTYNSYVPSDPRAISKIIPYILELGALSSIEDRSERSRTSSTRLKGERGNDGKRRDRKVETRVDTSRDIGRYTGYYGKIRDLPARLAIRITMAGGGGGDLRSPSSPLPSASLCDLLFATSSLGFLHNLSRVAVVGILKRPAVARSWSAWCSLRSLVMELRDMQPGLGIC